MRFNERTLVVRALGAWSVAKGSVVSRVRHLAEARRRRREHDQQFYRDLKAYCRAHNVSHVCEDDWKTRS
jgi:hypothetical protein